MNTYQTLQKILRTLSGFILYPDSLGQTNLRKICEILNINEVKK